jgi:hypothetical protein
MGGIVNDLAVADGSVWVAVTNGTSRIDPSSGQVTDVSGAGLGEDVGGGVQLIDIGGGAVWRSDETGSNRYDIATDRFVHVEADVTPRAISAFGGDVWIASCGTPATVTRLDAGTGQVVATIAAGGARCPYVGVTGNRISVAADGTGVWVTDGVNGTVSRVSDATNQVDAPIRIGDAPTAVAVGLKSVWVTVDGTGA